MKDNMTIYNAVREVPDVAKKTIGGGRLKGMTDVNPMWRIKTLTEQFGPCGIGWYYTIDRKEIIPASQGEAIASVDISLFVKEGEKWSAPIQGTGGSMFITNEKQGVYNDDECFKKALTDAISVACKALGVAADVYFAKDAKFGTKYDEPKQATPPKIKSHILGDPAKPELPEAWVTSEILFEQMKNREEAVGKNKMWDEIFAQYSIPSERYVRFECNYLDYCMKNK